MLDKLKDTYREFKEEHPDLSLYLAGAVLILLILLLL